MTFLGQRLTNAAKSAEDWNNRSDKAPMMPVGIHKLAFGSIELTASNKRTAFVMEMVDPTGRYRPTRMHSVILPADDEETTEWMDRNLSRILQLFLSIGYHVRDGKNAQDWIGQFAQFKDKQVQVAIQHACRATTFSEKPNELVHYIVPEIWYMEPLGKEVEFNASKSVRPLTDKERDLWLTWKGTRRVASGIPPEQDSTEVHGNGQTAKTKTEDTTEEASPFE